MNIKQIFNKEAINKMSKSGFFSVFISTIFSKVFVFFGSIVIVRILSKTEYGIYAYVLNCISMLCLLNDFGVSSASLQYLTENFDNSKKQGAILKYSIYIGFFASIASSLLIFLSPFYYPFTIEEAQKLTPILFILPFLTTINGLVPVIMRSRIDNRNYGRFQIFSTLLSYLTLIPMSLLFSYFGAIISQYLYNVIILIAGFFLVRKYLKNISYDASLSKKDKKEFLKFSIASQINNTLGGLLLVVDTFLIGLLVADSQQIACYKVASALPHALSFLPSCVVVYILPYFIKNNNNNQWLKKNFKNLTKAGSIIYGILCIILILFSKFIFALLYGNKYEDSIPIFIILIIGYYFSSAFKIPCSNITYSMRKVRFNIVMNIICIIINFISNTFFIKSYGAIGAAITTTIINIFSSIIYLIYVNKILNRRNDDI